MHFMLKTTFINDSIGCIKSLIFLTEKAKVFSNAPAAFEGRSYIPSGHRGQRGGLCFFWGAPQRLVDLVEFVAPRIPKLKILSAATVV